MIDYTISLCIFLPLLVALVALFWTDAVWVHRVALACAGAVAALCLYMVVGFDGGQGVQYGERWDWIPELGVVYHLGLDGLSLFPFAMTALALLLALAIAGPVRGEIAALSAVAGAALGAFAARDLLLFCLCAEAAVLPVFALLSREKSHPRAGLRMVLFGVAGGASMLVAVGYLAVAHLRQIGRLSFDLVDLQALDLPVEAQGWLLLALLVGLAVRMPLLPLHGWLSSVHGTTSPAVMLVLACGWLQLGAYGFMRFCPTLLPQAFAAWCQPLAVLAAASAVYGALMGLAQERLRGWFGCVTLSHMGWVVFGVCTLSPAGLQGAALLLLGHGLALAALLLLAGMVAEREGADRGMGRVAPRLSGWLLCAVLVAVGLPGTLLFAGEFLVLVAAFAAWGKPGLLILAAALFHGVAVLRLVRRLVGGAAKEGEAAPRDMRWGEAALVVPLLLAALALGLKPAPVLDRVAGAVDQVLVAARAERGEGE